MNTPRIHAGDGGQWNADVSGKKPPKAHQQRAAMPMIGADRADMMSLRVVHQRPCLVMMLRRSIRCFVPSAKVFIVTENMDSYATCRRFCRASPTG